jgi:hypothetical protein
MADVALIAAVAGVVGLRAVVAVVAVVVVGAMVTVRDETIIAAGGRLLRNLKPA